MPPPAKAPMMPVRNDKAKRVIIERSLAWGNGEGDKFDLNGFWI